MKEQEMIVELEEIMDLDAGTLSVDSVLADFEEWDSLSALSLIAMAKQKCGIVLTAENIQQFQTVQDIFDFLNR